MISVLVLGCNGLVRWRLGGSGSDEDFKKFENIHFFKIYF
jgi:hypothetical protein